MNLFQHLGHLVLSMGLIVSSFFVHSQTVHDQNYHIYRIPTPAPTVEIQSTSQQTASPSASFYMAERSINSQGHTISISVKIPKNGGNVSGNISGDCAGDISGHYDGKDEGDINGSANVSCKYLFVRLPGTATFDGTVDKTDKTAELYITLDFNGSEISQNVYVNLD